MINAQARSTDTRAGRRRSYTAVVGGVITLSFILAGLVAVWWVPADPVAIDLDHVLRPPGSGYLFGTDGLGRDILSRVLVGTRTSFLMGAAVTILGGTLGTAIGVGTGYFGGAIDLVGMRVVDVLLAFPGVLLALVLVTILGPGIIGAVLAVGTVQIPRFARLVRSRVLEIRRLEFLEAGRATGLTDWRLLIRYVLPNCLSVLVVLASLAMGQAVLLTAGLGFLGLGAQPPMPEWGSMLADARKYIQSSPHVMIFPGLAVFAAVLGFNLIGDALRDAWDVRLR